MKIFKISCIIASSLVLASCAKKEDARWQQINQDFAARQELLPAKYFQIFADSANMDAEMLKALKFMYAYMPVPDVTDYPGEYFAENAALSLRAKQEMPWGASVPEREFLHFVLPVRVNNENLDAHRGVFYEELKERVAGMSMAEAILEVNHWCHEKATYQPSDSRTHSPLATMSSAIGRCGEESTFTVAALRSIGIPARQVYTPRWAHTDDNHAWVEAWADGQWHFLGACEPEAVLDLGWFNDPAARGMLMNTRTIGRYDGPEEKLLQTAEYTDVNVTNNYAPVDTITVLVVDADGNPVEGATVDFRLYNYAEFYPIASRTTGSDGQASLVAGIGDLLVWASKDGQYAYAKSKVGSQKSKVVVELSEEVTGQRAGVRNEAIDIVPPVAASSSVDMPAALAEENNRRKAYEDSLRNAYTATFVDNSRGNYAVIQQFLNGVDYDKKDIANRLLASLSEKDMTDVTAEVLEDAMLTLSLAPGGNISDEFVQYVLSPRISNEFLVPFREKFMDTMPAEKRNAYRTDPSTWAQWVLDSIGTSLSWQPATVKMSPWAVWEVRNTNKASRDLFFVAAARAMGIPARIDAVSGKAQYLVEKEWCDLSKAQAEGQESKVRNEGSFSLAYEKLGNIDDPGYYTHFTISKIVDGRPQVLEYPEDATWKNTFARKQKIDAGDYMLVTGQRLADGSVLANTTFFTIAPGVDVSIPLVLRQDSDGVKVIGNFDSESLYQPIGENTPKSILSTTGRGYYVLGLLQSGAEPSNHAIRDLVAKKAELQASGIPMVLLFPSEKESQAAILADVLAQMGAMGIDTDGAIKKALAANLKLNSDLPIFIIADTFNRVVFVSQGYTIGLGQTLLDTLSKL